MHLNLAPKVDDTVIVSNADYLALNKRNMSENDMDSLFWNWS
jgi:hypothetical protein